MRNASCCFSKGLPKRAKTAYKTTCYTSAFSTSKRHPPNIDFGPSRASLGRPKAPPRGLQTLSQTTLASIFGHLGCKFQFLASSGVPPGSIFHYFLSKCEAFRRLLIKVLLLLRDSFAQRIASQPPWIFSFSTSQSCSMDCPFELIFDGVWLLLQLSFCTLALLCLKRMLSIS